MSGLFNWVFGRGTRKRKYKLKTVAIEPDSSNIEHFRTDPNSTVQVRIKPKSKPKSDSASRLSKDTNNMQKRGTTFASNNKEDNFTRVGFGVRIGLRKTKKQKFQKKSRKNRKK